MDVELLYLKIILLRGLMIFMHNHFFHDEKNKNNNWMDFWKICLICMIFSMLE